MRRSLVCWMGIFVLIFLAAGEPARASTEHLKLGMSAWPTGLSGTQRADTDTSEGTTTDLESTLGLNGETTPDFHALVNLLGPVQLVGSYFTTSNTGEEILGEPVTFSGTTYPISEEVRSEVNLSAGRLLFAFSPLDFEKISLGLGVGAEILDISSEMSSTSMGTESEDFTAPIPVVGMNLTLRPIKKLNVYVEASGFSAGIGDVNGKIMDGMLRAEYYFVPWIALTGGYRVLDFDVEQDEVGLIELKQDGAQLGLVFKI